MELYSPNIGVSGLLAPSLSEMPPTKEDHLCA